MGLAIWQSPNEHWSTLFALLALFIAFSAGLVEVVLSWDDEHERAKRVPARYVFAFAPAMTLMIYHVQRGLVMLITACAIVILPIVTALTRLIATVPGLDWLARGIISSVETALLVGAPTDVATISNNPVGSAGIQSRLRGGLAELEARVKSGGTITVVGHSAGTPLAWWLLSEPEIQKRQHRLAKEKRFRYRLITVGAALNWAKRGMDCTATDLERPLVRSDEHADAVLLKTDKAFAVAHATRVVWVNPHATWDPVSHGPVWPAEYKGTWGTRDDLIRAAEQAGHPELPEMHDDPPGVAERAGLSLYWLAGWILRVPAYPMFYAISFALPLFKKLALAPSGEPPRGERPDPNVFTRSLGSPISAEHSEYFRNQQEVIPLIVTSIDSEIGWAGYDIEHERRIRWANARSAMLSALVRARILVFALPLFAIGASLSGNTLVTACPEKRTDTVWQRNFGNDVPNTIHDGIDDVPVFGDLTDNVCNYPWIEDVVVIAATGLIAYALIDVYTEFLWSSLGRRVRTLDRRRLRAIDPKRDTVSWKNPATWRTGYIPLLPALAMWLPTMLAPLLILPFNTFNLGFWVLFGVNSAVVPFEAFWLDRCLRGVANPDKYPETGIPYGRLYDEKRRIASH
jgi:hypothetical protein